MTWNDLPDTLQREISKEKNYMQCTAIYIRKMGNEYCIYTFLLQNIFGRMYKKLGTLVSSGEENLSFYLFCFLHRQ